VRTTLVALRPMLALVLAGTCSTLLGTRQASASGHRALLRSPLAARRSTGTSWHIVARVAVPRKIVVMQSVAAVSPHDAWAAGFSAARGARRGKPVIERWFGRAWKRVTLPRKALRAFDRGPVGPSPIVGGSSPVNVWVFNQVTGAWLRWNGSRWSHGRLPAQPGSVATAITSELVLAGGDVWAFGGSVSREGRGEPYAARFDSRKWHVTPMPRLPNLLVSAASAVRQDDIWATIGYGGQTLFPPQANGGALARWNGHLWRLEPLPARFARHGDPTSIVARTDRDLWVGGGIAGRSLDLTEAAARWNGSVWQVVAAVPAAPSKADCVFRSLVPYRVGLLALGECFSSLDPGHVWSRLWSLTAGRWAGPSRPRLAGTEPVFLDLAPVQRAGLAWAAGYARGTGIIALSAPVPR
jgi:hypothetical protein